MKGSAGGIIVGPKGKIVLVEQHGNSWSFPKGHVEEGETLEAAARREIKEETGLRDLVLVEELGSYERYSIARDGRGETTEFGLTRRTLFLFTTTVSDLLPQDGEVTAARWVTLEEAQELLTHPKDKEFLTSITPRVLRAIQ